MAIAAFLALLALLPACGGPSGPVSTATAGLSNQGLPEDSSVSNDAFDCNSLTNAFVLEGPGEVPLTCENGFVDCHAAAEIVMHNCTGKPVQLVRMELGAEDKPGIGLTYDLVGKTLLAGESFKKVGNISGESVRELRVYYRSGQVLLSVTQSIMVTNSALEQAKAACRECNGEWGALGLAAKLGCNCATGDAGQTCYQSSECEGTCIYQAAELITTSHRLAGVAPTCAPGSSPYALRGECTSTVMNFGCLARLNHAAVECRGPSQPARQVPRMCVD